MSNVCCKEFTGWIKSFTRLERALTVLEAVLLGVLIVLLILLILHLIVCSKPDSRYQLDGIHNRTKNKTHGGESGEIPTTAGEQEEFFNNSKSENEESNSRPVTESTGDSQRSTEPGVKCSWTPSVKTTAATHYYEDGGAEAANRSTNFHDTQPTTRVQPPDYNNSAAEILETELNSTITPLEELEELIRAEQSDGEEAGIEYESLVTALVKLKPPKDVIFGCILTIISDYWTVTAASCIEAIEETDSLDSFVIMENYGTDKRGVLSTVEDVQIHPLYEGKNKSYDLAALKSSTALTEGAGSPVELATHLDYALLTLTQKFIILGYGAFRSVGAGRSVRRLRRAHVFLLPARRCARAGAGAGAALRHLWGARALPRPACVRAPLCAGVVFSRGLPCNYCAGAPLLVGGEGAGAGRAPRLLALLADSDQCGVACEPALYVSMPDLADWIEGTARADIVT